MDNKKIKVAMVTNHLGITGIGTVIINYCKELDKDKYDLTIIAGRPIANQYEKICKEYGVRIIPLPSRHDETKQHYVELWRVLKREGFDIIHDHGNSSMMAIELTIAKLVGIKCRIAHSHNSTCPNLKIHKLLNPYFKKIYTKALACGLLAGEWLFGKNKFDVLPNGFYTEKFIFSEKDRLSVRRDINVEDKFVMGHIGRINEQKNQEYLLQIFEKVAEKRRDVVLLLVGTGPDFEKINRIIQNNKYKDRIILYGETSNPVAMYSAMDIFVFPSKYEGLPVVLLEAQISGLPCIASDCITREVDFGSIIWKSINQSPDKWSDEIIKMEAHCNGKRIKYYNEHEEKILEYEITKTVKYLEKLYDTLEMFDKRD